VLDTQSTASTARQRRPSRPDVHHSRTGDEPREQGITDARDCQVRAGFKLHSKVTGSRLHAARDRTYDEAIAISPAVGVLHDQIPLPFARMPKAFRSTCNASRLLKGPQGTLFGEKLHGRCRQLHPGALILTPMTTPGMHP